jgi:hypothetical protein
MCRVSRITQSFHPKSIKIGESCGNRRAIPVEKRQSPEMRYVRREFGIGYYAESTRRSMDFIERIFGVSPDGGDGSLEFAYLTAVVVAGALVVYLVYRRRNREQPLGRNKSWC